MNCSNCDRPVGDHTPLLPAAFNAEDWLKIAPDGPYVQCGFCVSTDVLDQIQMWITRGVFPEWGDFPVSGDPESWESTPNCECNFCSGRRPRPRGNS